MPRVYPDTCIVVYLIEGSTEVQEVILQRIGSFYRAQVHSLS